uniref:Dehydration responsive element binding protein 1A n=1 Tax=Petunia axillaris TaxID=33119 RepID=A0A6M3W847_PETAX|nr:dehydration responsive element binding protein 1A [Petunia axillaris]
MNDNSSSCSSDLNPSSSSIRAAASSDEEFTLLASSRPKRRTGRKKFKETRHPVYRGVRRRNNNKWVCELREPIKQKRIWLGTYPTPEMAARAHDLAALALKGNLATLNFADSRWKLPVPVSKDPKDLRQAAVKAAQAFRQDPELVGVDYMNDEVNSRSEETVVNKELKMEMGSILCCTTNWGDNNEMLEESWQEKMANGRLFSPTPRIGSYFSWDDVEISDVEVSLWSYSV